MENFKVSENFSNEKSDQVNKIHLQKNTEEDSREIFDFQNSDTKESDVYKQNGTRNFPMNVGENTHKGINSVNENAFSGVDVVNENSYSGVTQLHRNETQLKSILKDDNIDANFPTYNLKNQSESETNQDRRANKINLKESLNKKDNSSTEIQPQDFGYYRSTPQQNNPESTKQKSIRKTNRDEYVPPIPEIIVHDEEGYKVKQDSYVTFDLPNKKDSINPFTDTKSCCEAFEYNDLYIRKYWDGRLKVMQFIATIGISICLPLGNHFYYPRFIYFRAAGITACLFVLNDLFLHLSSLWELLPKFLRYRTLHMILATIGAVCMLVGSSLILNVAGEMENESMSLLSVFFGFSSMLLFGIETILHLLRQRSEMPYNTKA